MKVTISSSSEALDKLDASTTYGEALSILTPTPLSGFASSKTDLKECPPPEPTVPFFNLTNRGPYFLADMVKTKLWKISGLQTLALSRNLVNSSLLKLYLILVLDKIQSMLDREIFSNSYLLVLYNFAHVLKHVQHRYVKKNLITFKQRIF